MTDQPQQPAGLDLSAVRHRDAAATTQAAPPAGMEVPSLVFDVTEATFRTAVDLSAHVPVIIDLWADWCGPCKQLSPILERLIEAYNGRLVLAKVDVDANPQIQQVFQAQSIPTVVALVKGQPVPLFQGALPEPQVKAYFDELLKLAEANGVTGTAVVAGSTPEETGPVEKFPEALAALEQGDYEAAGNVYFNALRDNPGDADAKAGVARVGLLQRTKEMDAATVRSAAADNPASVTAALAVADLDIVGGHVDDAYNRLLDLIRKTSGDEREHVRLRLIELFEVVGTSDARTNRARSALMRALF